MNKQTIKIMGTITVLALALLPTFGARANSIKDMDLPELIYGSDDRYEASDYPLSHFIELSRSVAIRVANKRLTPDRVDETLINFPHRQLKNLMPQLCPTERFIDQYSVGDCSGFLIAPNKLVTAGHCMTSENDCSSFKWVFDFKEGTTQFKKSNVYSCTKVVTQKYAYSEKEVSDYAVIELDRAVVDRKPLAHRKHGRLGLRTPLLVIGHPMGLPLKITDGANVSRMNDVERERKFHSWLLRGNYFTANLDSYAGNSGSPVFNRRTGKVEGILIQGADDFVFNELTQCLESLHLSDSHLNTYEKVMRINKVPGL